MAARKKQKRQVLAKLSPNEKPRVTKVSQLRDLFLSGAMIYGPTGGQAIKQFKELFQTWVFYRHLYFKYRDSDKVWILKSDGTIVELE